MSDWKKVNDGGNTPAWNPEEQKEISGKLVSRRDNVGPNGSTFYTVQQADGSELGVWGSTLLDDFLGRIAIGSEVKIVYKGKAQGKNGREYRNYDIYNRSDASQGDEEQTTGTDEIPF